MVGRGYRACAYRPTPSDTPLPLTTSRTEETFIACPDCWAIPACRSLKDTSVHSSNGRPGRGLACWTVCPKDGPETTKMAPSPLRVSDLRVLNLKVPAPFYLRLVRACVFRSGRIVAEHSHPHRAPRWKAPRCPN